MISIANHLWQSSLFAIAAGLLALALRKNRAHIRYRLWFAASMKFLIPFAMVSGLVSRVAVSRAPVIPPVEWPVAVQQAAAPFIVSMPTHAARASSSLIAPALLCIWLLGFALLVATWFRRWRMLRQVIESAAPIQVSGMSAVSSSAIFEPGVFGIWRPVLMLPVSVTENLRVEQLEAIIAHEKCHIRRRDNLAAALHMGVQAIFWFHPLIWWLGARLLQERERACDEEVLSGGIAPEVYAEGILQVCNLYLASPLPCVAGVTGSNLRTRIEQILDGRIAARMGMARKSLLAVAAALSLVVPLFTGVVNAPRLRAQSQAEVLGKPSGPKFEVASVKVAPDLQKALSSGQTPHFGAKVEGRRVDYGGLTMNQLLTVAFRLQPYQLPKGPAWWDSDRFDILATIPEGATKEQIPEMLQWLLVERFGLVAHGETKELQAYALMVGKDGPKMKPADANDDPPPDPDLHGGRGLITETAAGKQVSGSFVGPFGRTKVVASNGILHMEMSKLPMPALAHMLVGYLNGPVVDMTGLSGAYQVNLDFSFADTLAVTKSIEAREASGDTSGAIEPPGTSVFATIQRLGLRIDRRKAPVPMLVVDHVDRTPKEN